METKEAILSTISEFARAQDLADNSEDSAPESAQTSDENTADSASDSANIFIDIKEENPRDSAQIPQDDEVATLQRLREKSLVLFEGLRHIKDSSLEAKLEMVVNYLEYQLYVIDDRLKTLQDR